MSNDARLDAALKELRLELPPPAEPKGVYRPLLVVGSLAYTAGHLPVRADGQLIVGRVGVDFDVPAAYEAARWVGLGLLSTLRRHLGSLDRVARVVKVLGMVNGTAEFTQQPAVLNGCSELFATVFGPEAGVGVRSAVGVAALPLGVPVEIEAVFELAPQ